ncbi:RNA polymerase sigma factor [Planctomycetes bacterium Poly30]|uniref:RNA polymerase sigma factor n=1 Tax=Saltatorellus ferox TaxID=2528018 RepID=A0A518EW13_9BACT|nr:RNA polymerase sigma factor [Planctomycetes bacterium Poly30]
MTEQRMEIDSLLKEHGWLTRLATGLVGAGEAGDLVQDTYRAALESAPPRARERGRLRGWLRVIATRRAAERWREEHGRKGREAQHARDEDRLHGAESRSHSPSAELERAELRRFLAEAVLALDAPLRDVAVLRYFEDRSYAQIAARLDITEALARQRASRACAALRETLDGRSGGDRSAWMSALAPWVLRAPRWSARAMAVTGITAAVAVLLCAAWWWSPSPAADALEPLARGSKAALDEVANLTPPSPTLDGSGETDRMAAVAASEERETLASARAAFPLPPAEERATLDVQAIWDDTEEPASGLWLSAYGRQMVQADAAGRVRFANLPPGYGGLTSNTGSYLNLKLEPGELRSVTLRVRRELSVRGRVIDGGGRGVSGAKILVMTTSNGWSIPQAESDSDGDFELEGLSGYVGIAASHPDRGTSLARHVGGTSAHATELRLTLEGGSGGLSGIVLDEDGAPMVGAPVGFQPTVDAVLADAPKSVITGDWTDDEGRFRLPVLRPGPGHWTVRTARHGLVAGEAVVVRDKTTDLEIRLSRGNSIQGVVRDEATGEPVEQAIVGVGPPGDETFRGAMTDERGEFVIEGLQGTSAELTVRVMDEIVHERTVVLGTQGVKALEILIAPQTHSVHGFVLDEEGQPLVGCEVSAEGYRTRSWSARTDEAGVFRIPHAPLAATALEVCAPEPDASRSTRVLATLVDVLPRRGPIQIVVPMAKLSTGSVEGHVTTEDGAPVPDFDAEMEFLEGGYWGTVQGQVSGVFRFEGVAIGRHALTIRAPGMAESLTMLEVRADEKLELPPIVLSEGAMFRLDFAFDPPMALVSEAGERERVHVYEIRSKPDFGPYRLYLGEAEQGIVEFGPVPSGSTRLVIEGEDVYREIEVVVPAMGQASDAAPQRIEVSRKHLTPVAVEYVAATPNRAARLENEILSFGLSWRLRDGRGLLLRQSDRPEQMVFGERLRLHGLEPGALYLLEVEDVEGRSGSAEVLGGSPSRVVVR